jgi:outer membrane protein insertion porin family
MKRLTARGAAALLVSLLFSAYSARANPGASAPTTYRVEEYRWAHGRTIDSIYVLGNQKVRDFAIFREMELRVDEPFDLASFERDQRYIGDLSVFSSVTMVVEPVGDDRCAIRITVTERPTLLLKLIYPVLEYDLNTDRVKYGVKWNDRNFRKRLENFSVNIDRDNRDNNNASVQWNTRWVGWKRIGTYVRASYFHRGSEALETQVMEQGRVRAAVSLPLNDHRIRVADLLAGLGFADNRLGRIGSEGEDETLISPNLGFVFDDRNSPLRPQWGQYFFVNLTANRVLNGIDRNYFLFSNDVRLFRPLNEYTVIGLSSRFDYQFGEYPEYIRFNVGGAGSLRGYEPSSFRGAHRTFQSLELRLTPWAKRFYRLPFVGLSDFRVTLAAFVDGGITWSNHNQFNTANYHGGYGWGVRLYSPFQDVLRLDIAYDRYGRIRPYFSSGVRF